MPLTTIIVLAAVVAMFGSFMLSLGGVSTWIAICDWRERTAGAPRPAAERSVDHSGHALAA